MPVELRSRSSYRWAAIALFTASVSLMVGGGLLLYLSLRSMDAVAVAYGVRNGGQSLTSAEFSEAIAELDRDSLWMPLDADEAAALTFLHYGAADEAARLSDASTWRAEVLAARTAARTALRRSPMRGDIALALAELEYLLHAPQKSVEQPLALSFISAPRELWIVKRRVGLGLRLFLDVPQNLEAHIESDVRLLGEPFESLDNYEVLARAAWQAGPAAIALVREILARGHPWPFGFFNEDLERLTAQERGKVL